jgi:hypothetical protein
MTIGLACNDAFNFKGTVYSPLLKVEQYQPNTPGRHFLVDIAMHSTLGYARLLNSMK